MSAEAELFVEGLVAGGARLSSNERLALGSIAFHVHHELGYAYASVGRLAEKGLLHPKTMQRTLPGLVRKGRVRRYAVVLEKTGGRHNDEYELVGFTPGLGEAYEQGRCAAGGQTCPDQAAGQKDDGMAAGGVDSADDARQVSADGSTCTAAGKGARQVRTRPGGVSEYKARAGFRRVDLPATQDLLRPRKGDAAAVDFCGKRAVDRRESVTPPGTQGVMAPGDSMVSPRKRVEREYEEKQPPTPCLLREVEEKLPVNAKAKATADATATATTGAVRKLEAKRAVAGDVGMSPAAPDSDQAMFACECRRVLMVCGVAPETSTRRMRDAVTGALELRCAQARCSIGEAGDLAVRRWREYRELGERKLLKRVCGVRGFFREGLWLTPGVWPVDGERERRGRL